MAVNTDFGLNDLDKLTPIFEEFNIDKSTVKMTEKPRLGSIVLEFGVSPNRAALHILPNTDCQHVKASLTRLLIKFKERTEAHK